MIAYASIVNIGDAMCYTNKKEITVIHKCGGCKKKQPFINTGKFRVNANGNKLDVWLIYQCKKCKHSLNIPIYERTAPNKIPQEIYEKFLDNDEQLAADYGSNYSFFKEKHYEVL